MKRRAPTARRSWGGRRTMARAAGPSRLRLQSSARSLRGRPIATPPSAASSGRSSRRSPTSRSTASGSCVRRTRRRTEAHRRYHDAIAELEDARTEFAENRQSALWARLFPDAIANNAPNMMVLATGLRKPVERTLGLTTQVQADAVLRALREDADVLVQAMTADQARARPRQRGTGRRGLGRNEGARGAGAEGRQEARERYRREWGQEPGW